MARRCNFEKQRSRVMSARIVSLAVIQSAPAPVSLGLPEQAPARLQMWTGASGRRYVHSVYSLIECPPLPKATYLLVRRELDGRRVVLHVGQGQSDAATLNLAQRAPARRTARRQRGARAFFGCVGRCALSRCLRPACGPVGRTEFRARARQRLAAHPQSRLPSSAPVATGSRNRRRSSLRARRCTGGRCNRRACTTAAA